METHHDVPLPPMEVIDELQKELAYANAMLAVLLSSDFVQEMPDILRDYLKRVDELVFKSKELSFQLAW